MADSEDVITRLERGEVLRIDDQEVSYISMEIDESSNCFVRRNVLEREEREAKQRGESPQYEEKRFRSLAEALLSLTDYEWVKKLP